LAANELLRMENISKTFPGVKALDKVHFSLNSGEIHALIGENGAGKSTLIKILTGAYQMDPGGEIFISGKKVEINNPQDSKLNQIGVVYQDVMVAPHLSLGENFFLGKLPKKNGLVDWNLIYSKTTEILSMVDINIDPKTRVKDLPVAIQEMVSIAKIIYDKANIVIFDEPTALLTNEETDRLFEIIKDLKDRGCGIIYISHRLDEIFQICDKVTVLKDGQYIDTVSISEIDENKLVSMMVGRELVDMYNIEHNVSDEIVLDVKNLSSKGKFSDINFTLYKGEVLGFYGLVGSGRTEIMRVLFGADKCDNGEIFVNEKASSCKHPKDAMKKGFAFLTEDRKAQGLAMNLPVDFNVNMASLNLISKAGVLNPKTEQARSNHYCDQLKIVTPSIFQTVKNLSGGNQQKVVISKWLASKSEIFIFDEPTVGVDVGAKREIYLIIEDLIKNGASVILISSYLPEVMGLSDRIVVMYEGKISGIVNRNEFDVDGSMNENLLVSLASGIDTRIAEKRN